MLAGRSAGSSWDSFESLKSHQPPPGQCNELPTSLPPYRISPNEPGYQPEKMKLMTKPPPLVFFFSKKKKKKRNGFPHKEKGKYHPSLSPNSELVVVLYRFRLPLGSAKDGQKRGYRKLLRQ